MESACCRKLCFYIEYVKNTLFVMKKYFLCDELGMRNIGVWKIKKKKLLPFRENSLCSFPWQLCISFPVFLTCRRLHSGHWKDSTSLIIKNNLPNQCNLPQIPNGSLHRKRIIKSILTQKIPYSAERARLEVYNIFS